MYYEEKIINGKLCWRNDPDGEWIEFTAEQLTAKLTERRSELNAQTVSVAYPEQQYLTEVEPIALGTTICEGEK